MKKLSKYLGVSMLIMASLCTVNGDTYAAAAPTSGINLVINEVPIVSGARPMVVDGRTLAPIRVIGETLGATVTFDQATKKIVVTKDLNVIEMTLNKPQVKVNGITSLLDTVPVVKNGTTMLPLRFIGEALDCNVSWNGKTKTVSVKGNDKEVEKPVTEKKVDKWNRKIRTTNLPKNMKYYPYVVEGIPNWVYESIRINKATPSWGYTEGYSTVKTPVQLWEADDLAIGDWYMWLEQDLITRLNVDYRTINAEEFSEIMFNNYAPSSYKKGNLKDHAKSYVNFVKQHKIITNAEVQVLPETFWRGEEQMYFVNAYVKMTIDQQPDKSTGKMYDEFGAMYNPGGENMLRPKEDIVYEGVVQINLVPGSGRGSFYGINYNTADVMCQIRSDVNLFGGAKPAGQPSVDLKKQFK